MTPLVSVIVPTFNPGRFIDEALRSVVDQTFTDWECIVVDDGSTEDLSRVEKMDPRVRLVRQPNRGGAAARNKGILTSSGELIALLDHDDMWLPGKLAAQVEAMRREPDLGLCFTAFERVDSAGHPLGLGWGRAIRDYADYLGDPGGGPMPSSTVIRRDCFALVGLFDGKSLASDYDMFLRISQPFPMRFLDSVQMKYRQHGGNQTADYESVYKDCARILRMHLRNRAKCGDRRLVEAAKRGHVALKRNFARAAYDAARQSVRAHDWQGAMVHLRRAATRHPAYTVNSLLGYYAKIVRWGR